MKNICLIFKKISFFSLITGFILCLGLQQGSNLVKAGFAGSAVFSDVPQGSYFDQPIGDLYTRGIINGKSATVFAPGDPISRADVAVMINRVIQQLENQGLSFGRSGQTNNTNNQNANNNDQAAATTTSSSSSSRSSSSKATAQTKEEAGKIGFAYEKYQINEGSSQLKLTALRLDGTEGPVSAAVELVDDTAKSGSDFASLERPIVSFSGGETNSTITINLVNDKTSEQVESFKIRLKDPEGGVSLGKTGKLYAEAVIEIIDNDQSGDSSGGTAGNNPSDLSATANPNTASGGVFVFSATEYFFKENGGSATVTVTRLGSSNNSATVKYETDSGSANVGADFSLTEGELTFSSGETAKTIDISLYDNADQDGNEYFYVTLSNPGTLAALGTPSQTKVIIGDDEMSNFSYEAGTFRWEEEEYEAYESSGLLVVNIERIGGAGGEVKVTAKSTPATGNKLASEGSDYEKLNKEIIFKAGESQKQIIIKITKDSDVDYDELFMLKLENATNGAGIGTPNTTNITIHE